MATEEIEISDDTNSQCTNHPYRRNNTAPGGICALCLQEKLGKLLSSSFTLPFLPPSSSPSSSSSSPSSFKQKQQPFNATIVFKRTQSTATPRRNGSGGPPARSRFWSFIYAGSFKRSEPGSEADQKVCRSRSVGCGSRSFSGDLFERISSGFGDCTALRRVESERDGKAKMVRCGGIFGGFGITSSSSSTTSSSSSYLQVLEGDKNGGCRSRSNVKRRGWGWGFPSPMRVLGGKKLSKNRGATKFDSIPVTG